jgi:hypothetical protein
MHFFRLQVSSLERTYTPIPRLESPYNKRFSPIGFEWEIPKTLAPPKSDAHLQISAMLAAHSCKGGQPAYFGTTLFINS